MAGLFISSSHSKNTKGHLICKQNVGSNDNSQQMGPKRRRSEPGAKWTASGAAWSSAIQTAFISWSGPGVENPPQFRVTLSLVANDSHKRCSGDINRGLLLPSLLRDLPVFFFFLEFVSEGQRGKRDRSAKDER